MEENQKEARSFNRQDWINRLTDKKIVGILKINSTYKYPLRRNTPQYRWVSLDPSYPEFIVTSNLLKSWRKSHPTGTNCPDHYAVIKLREWPEKNNRPKGMIIDLIGPIGDWSVEYLARVHYHQLSLTKLKWVPPIELLNVHISPYADPVQCFPDLLKTHQDYTDLPVYSIDPEGCQDIDDAFSFDSFTHRIGIHIADVTYYLMKFGLLDPSLFKNRFATVYLPDEIKHLLPEQIATFWASLRSYRNRLSWTLWLDLTEDGELKDYSFQRTVIRNHNNLSYETADKILYGDKHVSSSSCPVLEQLSSVVKTLRTTILGFPAWSDDQPWTSHELVETLMIIANHLTAKFLTDNLGHESKMIYRVHAGSESSPPQTDSSELNRFLEILTSQSAIYTNGQDLQGLQDYYHYGLKLHYYTHFTSPIRRFPDIWIHLLLAHVIYDQPLPFDLVTEVATLDEINDFNQRTKRLQRDLDKLQLARGLYEGTISSDQVGYLINCPYIDFRTEDQFQSEKTPHLYLYLPDPKLLFHFQPFSEKVSEVIVMKDSEEQVIFENLNTGQQLSLPKYQGLLVKLWSNPQAHSLSGKIKVSLPGLSELLLESMNQSNDIEKYAEE